MNYLTDYLNLNWNHRQQQQKFKRGNIKYSNKSPTPKIVLSIKPKKIKRTLDTLLKSYTHQTRIPSSDFFDETTNNKKIIIKIKKMKQTFIWVSPHLKKIKLFNSHGYKEMPINQIDTILKFQKIKKKSRVYGP